MYLENISLDFFKNYISCKLDFSPDINCITGPNGSGKTNLLDAIHYLSLTKSAFNTIDQQNINHGQAFFSIRGSFRNQDANNHIICSCQKGTKKQLKRNGKLYLKLSEHIGLFPSVLISPYDTDILREGSSVRRKFLDGIISQVDPNYLQQLLKYQRLLIQRNQLLKDFAQRHQFDAALLESYDDVMMPLMQSLSGARSKFLEQYVPVFRTHYRTLSDDKEPVDITYKSDLILSDFQDKFKSNQQKDLMLQRTELGIHKDDLVCTIGDYNMRKFGSQGQQKSFVIAMKLAQFDVLTQEKQFKPILLLDDIFDKLDDSRISKLMEMVSGHAFGQIFITDARPERTSRILEELSAETRNFSVLNGTATQATTSVTND